MTSASGTPFALTVPFSGRSRQARDGLAILAFGEINPANDAEIVMPDAYERGLASARPLALQVRVAAVARAHERPRAHTSP